MNRTEVIALLTAQIATMELAEATFRKAAESPLPKADLEFMQRVCAKKVDALHEAIAKLKKGVA